MSEVFESLSKINVNDHTEVKDTGSSKLTYLSWPFAWAEVKKKYPNASYKIHTNEDNLPYVFDEKTGYMVFTSVTIEGVTHDMWLPVMDGNNKAMKSEEYTIKLKYKDITVKPATMFDVNKTIMRCLVKNLAMFGLGLYIYAGEDLPEAEKEEQVTKQEEKQKAVMDNIVKDVKKALSDKGIDEKFVLSLYKLKTIDDMTNRIAKNILEHLPEIKEKQEAKK